MNRYHIKTAFIFLLLVFMSVQVFGQTSLQGGKGLFRVLDAGNLRPGMFYGNAYLLSYFKTPTDSASRSIKDHTFAMGFTLALTKSVELVGQLVPYQDDQQSWWGPPGNITLGLKTRIAGTRTSDFGLMAGYVIPTGIDGPVAFEPYMSGEQGWKLLMLGAFDLRRSIPTVPMKLHLNIGYFDQNIRDRYFQDKNDQLLLGAALKFPIRSALFYTEFTGEIFLNNPDVKFMENSLRLTQGFRFIGPGNLIFDFAFDLGLDKQYNGENPPYVQDYANWKINFGISYQKRMFRPLSKEEKRKRKIREQEAKKLEEIRKQREKATQDLERMKKELEKEKQKEKEKDQIPMP